MRKIETIFICDRCHKQKELIECIGRGHRYELCDECKKLWDEYNNKINKLEKEYEKLDKEYKFGAYLPGE